jgi:TRAP-type C4-dicarboxylate transport system permease small subunit
MIKKLGVTIDGICLKILAVSIALLIILTVTPIGLRAFSITLPWVDPLVRHIVFFNIFLGSILATGKTNHITVDILAKFFEGKIWYRRFLVPVIYLITGFIVCWLATSSFSFAKIEQQFSREVVMGLGSGQVAWTLFVLFLILALRFFISAFDICLETYSSKEKS